MGLKRSQKLTRRGRRKRDKATYDAHRADLARQLGEGAAEIHAQRELRRRSIEEHTAPGMLNGYQCKTCRAWTVTVHVDAGVTPMLLACRVTPRCSGTAVSNMYGPLPDAAGPPTWEWYTPSVSELARVTEGQRQHVNAGGLLLRKAAF